MKGNTAINALEFMIEHLGTYLDTQNIHLSEALEGINSLPHAYERTQEEIEKFEEMIESAKISELMQECSPDPDPESARIEILKQVLNKAKILLKKVEENPSELPTIYKSAESDIIQLALNFTIEDSEFQLDWMTQNYLTLSEDIVGVWSEESIEHSMNFIEAAKEELTKIQTESGFKISYDPHVHVSDNMQNAIKLLRQ